MLVNEMKTKMALNVELMAIQRPLVALGCPSCS